MRLLVIADSKMLPALANGLRDGARFEVQTVPLSDPAAAQGAAENADAVALFYGAPGAPLAAALQALSPKVRERGGRIVAVLQREQAAQRDECFRAGASDLLFMPMPKEQFVTRLLGSVELSWPADSGAPAPVAVATRTASSKVDQAKVCPAGIEAPAELPLKPGETVRLQWGAFQSWGLVVRGGPSAQIRFAGLAPDEEVRIRDWLKQGGPLPSAPPPQKGTVSQTAPTPPGGSPASRAPAPAARPAPAAAAPTPGGTVATPSGGSPALQVRAAPASGPPPGFADRKPIRPQTRAPVRIAPPVIATPPSGAPPVVTTSPTVGPAVQLPAPSAPPPPPAAGSAPAQPGLAGLFDEGTAPPVAKDAGAEGAPAVAGPAWPEPPAAEPCKAAVAQFLKDRTVAADVPAPLATSVRKIAGMLGSAERAALEKVGPESHLADALLARISLDAATGEGVRLYSSSPAAVVDAAAVAALTRQADDAAARLQKEANAAVGKGEVESLQMITAASAALSRDLLAFKETADRLRGLAAAPRLGAGALDPDLVLPGQVPRPRTQASTAPPPPRAELRDFRGLDEKPGRAKRVLATLAVAAFLAALANALYFSLPHHSEIAPAAAGRGVERIDVSGNSALITVSPSWLDTTQSGIPALIAALKDTGVKKAILILPNGTTAGLLDLTTGRVTGLMKPVPPPPPK